MYNLEELLRFILDSIANNQADGKGSVLTIQIAPYEQKDKKIKNENEKITTNDVLDAHEALENFDGDFKRLWSK